MATAYLNQSYGSTTGSRLAVLTPLYTSGITYYVHSGTGNNAYAGIDRKKPFADLSTAHTAAAAGDTIRILQNHEETLTGSQALNKARVHIYGEGSGANRPRFVIDAAVEGFNISAADVCIENLWFPQAPTNNPASKILAGGVRPVIHNCQFDGGNADTNCQLKINGSGDGTIVQDCTFTSTATVITTQPARGIEVTAVVDHVTLDNVTFDGGTYGWSSYAFDCTGGSTVTNLVAYNISLLNSSRFYYLVNASTYRLHLKDNASMSSYVVIA